VEQIIDYKQKGYTLDDLKKIVISKDYNSVTTRWGHAFFKKVDGDITRDDLSRQTGAKMYVLNSTH